MTQPNSPVCSIDAEAEPESSFIITDEQLNNLIGIPFLDGGDTPDGCDCYGLVRLFYRQVLGVSLPKYPYQRALDGMRIERWVNFGKTVHPWQKTTGPIPGDVVLFSLRGRVCHCGVLVHDGYFLHCMKGTASCLERLCCPVWIKRIDGFYQWCPE